MKTRLLLLTLFSFYYQSQAQTVAEKQKDIEKKICNFEFQKNETSCVPVTGNHE